MDITKLHPIHKEAFKRLLGMGFPDHVLQRLYDKLVILADIPEKDWGKKSTTDRLK